MAIRETASEVQLDLDAYVHYSDGRPGVDAGTGWVVAVTITVRDGVLVQTFTGELLSIADGTIVVGASSYDNQRPARRPAIM